MKRNKFDVHLHAVVRVKIAGVPASNAREAAQRAQQLVDLNRLLTKRNPLHRVSHIEFDDSVTHLLVEPCGNASRQELATSKCFETFGKDGLTEVPFDKVSTHIAVIVQGGDVQSVVTNRPCLVAVLNHEHAESRFYDVDDETEFHDSEVDPSLHCHREFRTRYAKEKST